MSRMIPAVASIAELKVHQKWSRGHAGRPAGRAIAANRGGLTVEEKRRKQQGFRNSKKKKGFRIIPRIIPESYPNHASNFPSLNHGTFAKSGLVFCEHFFLRNYSPQATPPAASEKNPTAAPRSESCSLQWHQHANSKAHTPL